MPSNNTTPRPSHASRNASVASTRSQHHAPSVSSGLRQSHTPSSLPSSPAAGNGDDISTQDHVGSTAEEEPHFVQSGIQPVPSHMFPESNGDYGLDARGDFRLPFSPGSRTRLLDHDNWDTATGCDDSVCGHGLYSPRSGSPHRHQRGYGSIASEGSRNDFGGPASGADDMLHTAFGDTVADGLLGGRGGKMSTTKYLARRHGIRHSRAMYVQQATLWERC